MSFEEQVEMWFEEALQAVDEDQLIGSWISKLGGIHPAVQYHEVSKNLNPEFRMEEWNDDEWRADVKNKLLSLEHHPY